MPREALVLACHTLNPAWWQRADAALRRFYSWGDPLLYLRLLLLVAEVYPRWSAAEQAELKAALEERGVSAEQVLPAMAGLLVAVIQRWPDACRALRELSDLSAVSPNLRGIECFDKVQETYRRVQESHRPLCGGPLVFRQEGVQAGATSKGLRDAPELAWILGLMDKSETVRDAMDAALARASRELASPRLLGGGRFAWCGRFRRLRLEETAQAIRVLDLSQRGLLPTEIARLLYPDVPLQTGRVMVRKALRRIYPVVFNMPPPDGRRRTNDEESLAPCVAEDAESSPEEEFSCPVCSYPVRAEDKDRHKVCAIRVEEERTYERFRETQRSSAAVRRKQFAEEQEWGDH